VTKFLNTNLSTKPEQREQKETLTTSWTVVLHTTGEVFHGNSVWILQATQHSGTDICCIYLCFLPHVAYTQQGLCYSKRSVFVTDSSAGYILPSLAIYFISTLYMANESWIRGPSTSAKNSGSWFRIPPQPQSAHHWRCARWRFSPDVWPTLMLSSLRQSLRVGFVVNSYCLLVLFMCAYTRYGRLLRHLWLKI